MGTWTLIVPLACIVAAAILLALASRSGSSRPEHSDLAEEAEHRTKLPDEADVVPIDRRGRRA